MNKIRKILYLGWLGQANVGDELLFSMFKSLFYGLIDRGKTKDEFVIDGCVINENYRHDLSTYDLVVLGGGSIFHLPYYLQTCIRAQSLGVPTVSFGSGVDGIFKGGSSDFEAGIFLDEQCHGVRDQLSNAASNMKLVSVRGLFTKAVLCSVGVDESRIHVVSDPALFYDENHRVVPERNEKRLLVNWGTTFNHLLGGDEVRVERELAIALRFLISRGFKVTIYPIWWKDIDSVSRLAGRVNDERCEVIREVRDAFGITELLKSHDIAISLKLHANIIAAAAGVPFIALGYRGKCFEFMESTSCQDLVIGTDKTTACAVLRKLRYVRKNSASLGARLAQSKQNYSEQLWEYMRKVCDLIIQ